MHGQLLLYVFLIKFVDGNVDVSNVKQNEIPSPNSELNTTSSSSEPVTTPSTTVTDSGAATIIPATTVAASEGSSTVTTTSPISIAKLQTTPIAPAIKLTEISVPKGHFVVLPKGEFMTTETTCAVTAFDGAILNFYDGVFPVSSMRPFKLKPKYSITAPLSGEVQFMENCKVKISPNAREKVGELKEKPTPKPREVLKVRLPKPEPPKEPEMPFQWKALIGFVIFAASSLVLLCIGGLIGCSVCSCIVAYKEKNDPEEAEQKFDATYSFTNYSQFTIHSDKDVIIVVHSYEGNFVRRDLIRQTYGGKEWKEKFGFEVLFVVGRSTNLFFNKWLREEAERFGDIIQADFHDDYRNLTIKAMVWLRYTTMYCNSSTFIMHLDDDIIIDLFSIMHNFFGGNEKLDTNTIYCLSHSLLGKTVERNSTRWWYVPESVYPSSVYPIFCGGAAYVIPTSVVHSLIKNLEEKPYLSVDDALITGIAREECGVDIKQVLPQSIREKPPSIVLEEFRQGNVIVADCTERCSAEAWKILLSRYHNQTDPVSLRIRSLSLLP